MGHTSRRTQAAPLRDRRRPGDWRAIAAVALGGAIGASARYAINLVFPPTPSGLPWTTFVINVSGAFALGLLVALLLSREPLRAVRWLQPLLCTGLLGSFTTFSTLSIEVVALFDSAAIVAITYVWASLVFGLSAGVLGMLLGRRLSGRSRPGEAS